MITTIPDDDAKGNIDLWIGNLKVASRKRRFSVKTWGELSIRYERRNGTKTEYAKILAGECQAELFLFDFTDAWVIVSLTEIRRCLQNKIGYAKWNDDEETSAWYVPLAEITHLLIEKESKF